MPSISEAKANRENPKNPNNIPPSTLDTASAAHGRFESKVWLSVDTLASTARGLLGPVPGLLWIAGLASLEKNLSSPQRHQSMAQ